MLELSPLVEPISIDEAFLDLTGTERVHGASPARTLVRFAARVEREVGITVSVGLSYNKFLAKIASDQEKPRGFSVLGRTGRARRHLAPAGRNPARDREADRGAAAEGRLHDRERSAAIAPRRT
jgi:DNA polymerase-4